MPCPHAMHNLAAACSQRHESEPCCASPSPSPSPSPGAKPSRGRDGTGRGEGGELPPRRGAGPACQCLASPEQVVEAMGQLQSHGIRWAQSRASRPGAAALVGLGRMPHATALCQTHTYTRHLVTRVPHRRLPRISGHGGLCMDGGPGCTWHGLPSTSTVRCVFQAGRINGWRPGRRRGHAGGLSSPSRAPAGCRRLE